jgi:hypothetical protein
MNGIELQDRELFAAIRECREPQAAQARTATSGCLNAINNINGGDTA